MRSNFYGPWIISVPNSNGYCRIVMFLCMFDHRRVTFSLKTDVDQSVLSFIRFELVAYKWTIRASNKFDATLDNTVCNAKQQ